MIHLCLAKHGIIMPTIRAPNVGVPVSTMEARFVTVDRGHHGSRCRQETWTATSRDVATG